MGDGVLTSFPSPPFVADKSASPSSTLSAADVLGTSKLSEPRAEASQSVVPISRNFIATVNLKCRMNMKTIACGLKNAVFDRKKRCVVISLPNPKTQAMVWTIGTMIVIGATSERDTRFAARKYIALLRRLGFDAKLEQFKVVNIEKAYHVGFCIDLPRVASASACEGRATYYPEEYPAVLYRAALVNTWALIYESGEVTMAGKSLDNIQSAYDCLLAVLTEFRKDTSALDHAAIK